MKGIHDTFFALLKQMPGAIKEEIVWQYSGMLTTSLREFFEKKPEDYKRMIADLQIKINQGRAGYDPEIKTLRSAILHRLQKHGVDTTSWSKVNTFLAQTRISGKMLFEMNKDEMRKLIARLEMILHKDSERKSEELKLSESN